MNSLNVLIVDCAGNEQQPPHEHAPVHGLATIIGSRAPFVLSTAHPIACKLEDVGRQIAVLPTAEPGALVVYADQQRAEALVPDWLTQRGGLVVMLVDRNLEIVLFAWRDYQLGPVLADIRRTVGREISITNDVVVIKERNPGVDALLEQLVAVTEHSFGAPAPGFGELRMIRSPESPRGEPPVGSPPVEPPRTPPGGDERDEEPPSDANLLNAAITWLETVLPPAVASIADGTRRFNRFTFTPETIAHAPAATPHDGDDARTAAARRDEPLLRALEASHASFEPLAVANRAMHLSSLEFRILVLALAPDIDPRYQRCIALLSDHIERRVGTLGLYCSLIGDPVETRAELERDGNLSRARAFASRRDLPASDEPIALDPALSTWILGNDAGLESDPLVRRLLGLAPWPGESLIVREEDHAAARRFALKLLPQPELSWLVVATHAAADWRAFLQLGLRHLRHPRVPLRVEAARLSGLDVIDVEDAAIKLGRLATCTRRPLVIDVEGLDPSPSNESALRVLIEAIAVDPATCHRPPVTVLCEDEARVIRLIGMRSLEVWRASPLGLETRTEAVLTAAERAGVTLDRATAESLARRHQLDIAEFELAQSLAASRRHEHETPDESRARMVTALNEAAAQNLSAFAERVEPVFELDDVQLPADRKHQLQEIIDNVLYESDVLDGWRFGEQLPYGRGVAVLFHGPSGTGKTMASFAIAKRLGVQVLRLNLSKVMSRWLGESEKAMDRILTDAETSGCAVMVEEADALLHRRSDVLRGGSSSHERYSDVEIAFLLTRLENYTGLAFFTTNLRQNVDPAFLRRLRFVVEFPRPDIEARTKIWRRCLPEDSHAIAEGEFRQLARRLDVTGGSIRQITIRAAFLAVAENARSHQPFSHARIRLSHIAEAARAEYAKLGLPPVELDITQRAAA